MCVPRITRAENRGQSPGSSTVIGKGAPSEPVLVAAGVEEPPFRAASASSVLDAALAAVADG